MYILCSRLHALHGKVHAYPSYRLSTQLECDRFDHIHDCYMYLVYNVWNVSTIKLYLWVKWSIGWLIFWVLWSSLIWWTLDMQCNCAMGLLPEINWAWLVIDSNIYVWNYENGKDLAYFDGLNEVILSAGLVLPRIGVFQDHLQFLLCLNTAVEIVILGVSFTGKKRFLYWKILHNSIVWKFWWGLR